jgi:hypothetical protein
MFRSFFMAGFEGATGWSHRGHWFDQVAATGHEKTVDADYKSISAIGLHAAREAVRWPLVDKGRGVYDFSSLSPFLSAARRHHVDPICHVTLPLDKPELAAAAADFNNRLIYQAWDMISGRLLPELGGSPAHLGVIGMNYYWTNQWELGAASDDEGVFTPLGPDDPRRVKLSELVRAVHARYGHPLMITETSHSGPILGMHEWHEPETWTPMGLWHPLNESAPHTGRECHEPMRNALLAAAHLEKLHASGRDKHEADILSLRAFASRQRRLKAQDAARLSRPSLVPGKP